MPLTIGMVGVVLLLVALLAWFLARRRRSRIFLEAHSIDAEQLHGLLFGEGQGTTVEVFDVRQPLDLLAYSEIIPGARRVAPKEILENPQLIPRDTQTVVYCTCPSDQTSRKILDRAASLGFEKVKLLKGGLDAWKEKSYPVEAYQTAFHLDTPSV